MGWERWLVMGVPAVIALVCAASLVSWLRFFRAAARVRGVVSGHRESTDEDGDTRYRSVVGFAAEGREWEVVDEVANRPASHAVGREVWIYYPPGDPARGRVGRFWPVVVAAALMVVGVGLCAWLFARD